MEHFEENRREVTSDFFIIGKEQPKIIGENSVTMHTSGVIRELNVQGRTYQEGTPIESNLITIQSMNGDGVKVLARGINVFDGVGHQKTAWFGVTLTRSNNIFTFNGENTGSQCALGIPTNITRNLKPNTTYTCRLTKISGSFEKSDIRFYWFSGTSSLVYKGTVCSIYSPSTNSVVGQIKFTEEDIAKGIHVGVYSYIYSTAVHDNYSVRADIVEGSYTVDTFPNFEPYIAPKSIKIDTELHGIDGYNDILTLDFANNRVEAKRKVKVVNLVDLIDENAEIRSNNGENAIIIRLPYIWQEGTKSYCSHCKLYGEIGSNKELFFELLKGSETNLYFYWIEQTTVDEFYNWALENNVKIAFVTEDETVETVDFNLPKDFLPYNLTSVIEVCGSNGIDAVYYDIEERN